MNCLAFKDLRKCACGNIRITTRALTRFYDNHLQPCGLRSTQLSLLLNISLHEDVSVGELAEILAMDQTTVTRNLEGLHSSGYVSFQAADGDARKKLLSITPAGLAKLNEALPLWEAAQRKIETGLGRERLKDFLTTLAELTAMTK